MRIVIRMNRLAPLHHAATEALDQAGVTTDEAAAALGVHPSTIQRRLSAKPLTVHDLHEIAKLARIEASTIQRRAEGEPA